MAFFYFVPLSLRGGLLLAAKLLKNYLFLVEPSFKKLPCPQHLIYPLTVVTAPGYFM